ncbi:AbrB/MazE/SpoVT family DNA-binding domain-containing protein [Levilactobacillus humaensis]|uniref:AbrB/MazE/SpoVT family DNA-binding domain-containing protein n=1 Tax=Levilactobacillus humaensis TaxID=2950375 RepID=UPI0021C4C015|nr:antitoxin MazE [Levilactobacillus humaensis]
MKITMRKIGGSVGFIFPRELEPEVGQQFTVVKIGDALCLTPAKGDLFANTSDWVGFRESLLPEDKVWDEAED